MGAALKVMTKIAKSTLPIPAISRDYKNRLETIENCVKVSARYENLRRPGSVLAYMNLMSRLRSEIRDNKGMTQERLFLYLSRIPRRLFDLMSRLFGPEWRNDPKTFYPFIDANPLLVRMNETSRPKLDIERAENPYQDIETVETSDEPKQQSISVRSTEGDGQGSSERAPGGGGPGD